MEELKELTDRALKIIGEIRDKVASLNARFDAEPPQEPTAQDAPKS